MKNILIRADSSSVIGTGHIMRDLVLASQYKDDNIIFAIQELKGNINHKVSEAGYKIEILKSNDIEEVIGIINKYSIDMIVIDSYFIDYEYEKDLKKETSIKILVLDDTYEKHYCDVLLNHNFYAERQRYKELIPDNSELRCGSEYTLLREEFIQEKQNKKSIVKKDNFLCVFVAMGGTDHSNININILKVLKNFSNIQVNLVTTTANQHLEELQEYVKDKKTVTLYVNTDKIAKLMSLSDFAIVTPSVSVNEVLYMNLPLIAIKTAQNQSEMCNYLQKHNYWTLEKFESTELSSKVQILINTINVKLVNFTDLSFEEKKMILEWRNNPKIREWMFNQKEIDLEDHLNYIESLKTKKDRIYFLVKKENKPVGVIDVTNIDLKKETAAFGIYSNPELIGVGNLLMGSIINYAFRVLKVKSLKAKVFEDNESAIKLYNRYQFRKIDLEQIDDKNLIYMELKSENR